MNLGLRTPRGDFEEGVLPFLVGKDIGFQIPYKLLLLFFLYRRHPVINCNRIEGHTCGMLLVWLWLCSIITCHYKKKVINSEPNCELLLKGRFVISFFGQQFFNVSISHNPQVIYQMAVIGHYLWDMVFFRKKRFRELKSMWKQVYFYNSFSCKGQIQVKYKFSSNKYIIIEQHSYVKNRVVQIFIQHYKVGLNVRLIYLHVYNVH